MKRELIPFDTPSKISRKLVAIPQKKSIRAFMHCHEEFEFLYVVNGELLCSTEEQSVTTVKEGEIVFINSEAGHQTEFTIDGTAIMGIQFKNLFHKNKIQQHLSLFSKSARTPIFLFKKDDKDYEQVKTIFFSIFENSEKNDFSSECNVMSGVYAMMSLLHRRNFLDTENDLKNTPVSIIAALEYIEQNYMHEINLETLADMTGFSKVYFSKLFKKLTGTNVTEYVNFVRICKATELMDSTYTFSEIAYKVGFSSLAYFSKTFKKYRHCAPSDYKKMTYTNKNI